MGTGYSIYIHPYVGHRKLQSPTKNSYSNEVSVSNNISRFSKNYEDDKIVTVDNL